jgi:hypothetical protein
MVLKPMDSCCICHPELKPNPDLCPRHKEQAILTAIETNIRISQAADGMYWDAKELLHA